MISIFDLAFTGILQVHEEEELIILTDSLQQTKAVLPAYQTILKYIKNYNNTKVRNIRDNNRIVQTRYSIREGSIITTHHISLILKNQ